MSRPRVPESSRQTRWITVASSMGPNGGKISKRDTVVSHETIDCLDVRPNKNQKGVRRWLDIFGGIFNRREKPRNVLDTRVNTDNNLHPSIAQILDGYVSTALGHKVKEGDLLRVEPDFDVAHATSNLVKDLHPIYASSIMIEDTASMHVDNTDYDDGIEQLPVSKNSLCDSIDQLPFASKRRNAVYIASNETCGSLEINVRRQGIYIPNTLSDLISNEDCWSTWSADRAFSLVDDNNGGEDTQLALNNVMEQCLKAAGDFES